jgi:hypothetical protein
MKKTYKNPTLTVVKIQPAQFIATSDTLPQGSNYSGEDVQVREAEFSDWDETFE